VKTGQDQTDLAAAVNNERKLKIILKCMVMNNDVFLHTNLSLPLHF